MSEYARQLPKRRTMANRRKTEAELRTERKIDLLARKKAAKDKREAKARKVLGIELPEDKPIKETPAPEFKLTPKQDEAMTLLSGTQRHTLLAGGSRSGKTFLFVRAVVIRAMRAPNSRHVIFRMRANACRQTVWMDTLPKVMRLCFQGRQYENHLMDGYVTLPNGSEIWMSGLDDKERVEKILGMEFVTIYFNECSQIPYASVETALTRLSQKIPGLQTRAYYDLNPTTHKHWTFMEFVNGQHPINRIPLKDPHNFRWMRINPVDNADNIDPEYIASLEAMSARARKRFLDGEYLTEVDGALWSEEILEANRVDSVPEAPQRVVVAVDPSGAAGEEDKRSDEIGINVSAKIGDHAFVLRDATLRASPEKWGRRVVELVREYQADCVVAEKNFGGDMVRSTIHAVDQNVKVKLVSAARGKWVRAEPVSALYEKGHVHHVGDYRELEDEMQAFSVDGFKGDRSPNRTDALVWAITELLLGETTAGLYNFYRDMHQAVTEDSPVVLEGGIVTPTTLFDPIEYMKQLAELKSATVRRARLPPGRAW